MEENNLPNRSVLENEIELQDSEQENSGEEKAKETSAQSETEYVFTYSGQAMNQLELFQLSAHEDLNLILVAGPFSSGKTTLETMLYYVFSEGRNQKLNFGGSYTIQGFRKRSEKIMYRSGEPEQKFDRTLRKDTDIFLHLRVCDGFGQDQNLIFSDLPGEVFENTTYVEDYCEMFENVENVIVIIDGEKVCEVKERKNVFTETIIMIKMFLQHEIITRSTKVQVICTKLDKIQSSENAEGTLRFVKTNWERLRNLFENEVFSIDYAEVSAQQIEEESESEKLEEIVCKCMQTVPKEEENFSYKDTLKKTRQFEYFGIRG